MRRCLLSGASRAVGCRTTRQAKPDRRQDASLPRVIRSGEWTLLTSQFRVRLQVSENLGPGQYPFQMVI